MADSTMTGLFSFAEFIACSWVLAALTEAVLMEMSTVIGGDTILPIASFSSSSHLFYQDCGHGDRKLSRNNQSLVLGHLNK